MYWVLVCKRVIFVGVYVCFILILINYNMYWNIFVVDCFCFFGFMRFFFLIGVLLVICWFFVLFSFLFRNFK